MTPDRDQVLDFLLRLGQVCAVPRHWSVSDVAVNVREYVPMLCCALEADAFTDASLEHVAGQCRYFPTYAELRGHLVDWYRENRPRPPVLAIAAMPATPEAPDEPVTPAQRQAMREQLAGLSEALRSGRRSPPGALRRPQAAIELHFPQLTPLEQLAAYHAVAALDGPSAAMARARIAHLQRRVALALQPTSAAAAGDEMPC